MKKNRILFLDPKKEVDKILKNTDYRKYKSEYNGQLLYRNNITDFKKYDLIACINTANPYNCFLLSKCTSAGIRTLTITDGIYEWENAYNNPKHKRNDIALHDPIPSSAIVMTGGYGQKYLKTINSGTNFFRHIPYRMQNSEMTQQCKSAQQEKIVLLTSARTSSFSTEELQRAIVLYSLVIKECESQCIKIRYRIFDENLAEHLKIPKKDNNLSGSFKDSLQSISAVISSPSSVCLEAMANFLPVAIIDYRDSPIFMQSGWRIHQSVSIPTVLNSMMQMEESRMKYQSSVIAEFNKNDFDIDDAVAIAKTNVTSTDGDRKIDQDYYASKILESKWNFNLEILAKKILTNLGFRK